MKKYLYLPCVAILALAACDEGSNGNQQQSDAAPNAQLPSETVDTSVTDTAVQESVADGSTPVADVTTPEEPAPTTAPATDAPVVPPEGDTMGNAGPDAGMSAAETPPVPSPETFNTEAASKTTEPDKTCGDYNSWIGTKLDEGALKATGKPYRILKPGAPMTMDHNPERVNVEHDDAKTVMRVWCG